jgi:hypothetical protein
MCLVLIRARVMFWTRVVIVYSTAKQSNHNHQLNNLNHTSPTSHRKIEVATSLIGRTLSAIKTHDKRCGR